MLHLWWLAIYPATCLAGLLLIAAFVAWDERDLRRRVNVRLAEDREVAALDSWWELPAREPHA
jgi:hypothetical protein